MGACFTTRCVTSGADALFQCLEGVFHPRLPNLFEALIVGGAAAHPIKVLRNDWMIRTRQREPVDWRVTNVTGIGAYGQTNLCRVVSLVVHVFNVSNNNIRPWGVWRSWTESMLQGRHHQ